MNRIATVVGVLALLLVPEATRADGVPQTVAFTARVVQNGAPATGAHEFRFKLFQVETGGTAVWEEPETTISVTDGLVFHELGSLDPLDATTFTGSKLYLQIAIDGTITEPRIPIESVPYAMRAAVAESAETLGMHAPDDFVTGVTAGNGLTGGGSTGDVTLGVLFAGSGIATTVARSDHSHAGTYLPVGPSLTCATGRVTGIEAATGSVVCGADPAPGTGLTAGFNVAFAGTGSAVTVARSDHDHTGTYQPAGSYLPRGTSLSCATGKVTGIDSASGNVSCGADPAPGGARQDCEVADAARPLRPPQPLPPRRPPRRRWPSRRRQQRRRPRRRRTNRAGGEDAAVTVSAPCRRGRA